MNARNDIYPAWRTAKRGLGALLFATALTSPLAAQEPSGAPVKIGVIVDRSGVVVSLSRAQQEALETTAKALMERDTLWASAQFPNAKRGILGRPIEFLYEDTQSDPNQALSKSRRLASMGAQAIVITTVSSNMLQARLVCEEVKIICIGPSVANTKIVQPPNNTYAFLLGPSFTIQGEELIAAFRAAGYNSVGIVRDDTGSSKAQSEAFRAVFDKGNIAVATEEVIPAGAREITGQLIRLRDAKPAAVLNLVNPPVDSALFMKSYQAQKIGLPLFAMGGLISQPDTWKLAGPAIDGTIAVDYNAPTSEAVKPFVDRFHAAYRADSPILSVHPMTATALLVLKKAMEDAGATSGDGVKAAMEKISNFPAGFGQPGYTINFTPEDHNGATNASIVLIEFENGRPGKVWPTYQPKR